MIKKKLSKVKNELNKSKQLRVSKRKLFADYSAYMCPGIYHVESVYGKMMLKKGLCFKPKKGNILYFLTNGYSVVRCKNSEATCSLAVCSPFSNYKLFDTENEKTYSFYSEKSWNRISLFVNEMGGCINTAIIGTDESKRLLEEIYVKDAFGGSKVDYKLCFESFANEYLSYYSKCHPEKEISLLEVRKYFESAELTDSVREYVDYIEDKISDYDTRYPVIVCHNDVNTTNILTTDNKDFKLIDYELCGENVFYYDMMGLVFDSAVFRKNRTLFDKYLEGLFDEQIRNMFDVFGQIFEVDNRMRYLYEFLLFRIKLIHETSPEHLATYSNRLWEFFHTYNL